MSESRPVPTPEELSRFLAGNATSREEEEVRRWLAERSEPRIDVEAALSRVKARNSAPAKAFTPRFVALAAAALVIMVAGAIVARREVFPETSLQRTTAVGQRDSLVLDDGTRILLGPSTTVAVQGREVDLTGEAYFDVMHDASKPFTVRALGAVIRDIGTAFAVSGDSGSPLRVVVREGIVEIRHANERVTLNRGDLGVVDSSGRVEARRGGATPEDLAWLDGRLVFRNASLAEVAADLRRWYGVELRVSDSSLLQRHFTGEFTRESADRVLEVVTLALGAAYERRGDTVFVRPAKAVR